jgi:hypothetical protein
MASALANVGQYSKFIVAFIGAVTVGLTTFFPAASWEPTVAAVLSALAVYLIPNQAGTAPAAA